MGARRRGHMSLLHTALRPYVRGTRTGKSELAAEGIRMAPAQSLASMPPEPHSRPLKCLHESRGPGRTTTAAAFGGQGTL